MKKRDRLSREETPIEDRHIIKSGDKAIKNELERFKEIIGWKDKKKMKHK
ncbi:MAG: hypothetical protein ACRCWQ_11365 [Bacilli bacterium]